MNVKIRNAVPDDAAASPHREPPDIPSRDSLLGHTGTDDPGHTHASYSSGPVPERMHPPA